LLRAQKAFNDAWREYFASLPLLPDDKFWYICDVFRIHIYDCRYQQKRQDGVKNAVRELYRRALTGEASNYTLSEAICFAKTYEDVSHRLSKRYWDAVTGLGDDSYGDLMDALPLAGPGTLKWQVMETKVLYHRVQKVFDELNQHDMARLVNRGENYIGMRLRDYAKHYWRSATIQCERAVAQNELGYEAAKEVVPDEAFDEPD
jgi:hypothetical protein